MKNLFSYSFVALFLLTVCSVLPLNGQNSISDEECVEESCIEVEIDIVIDFYMLLKSMYPSYPDRLEFTPDGSIILPPFEHGIEANSDFILERGSFPCKSATPRKAKNTEPDSCSPSAAIQYIESKLSVRAEQIPEMEVLDTVPLGSYGPRPIFLEEDEYALPYQQGDSVIYYNKVNIDFMFENDTFPNNVQNQGLLDTFGIFNGSSLFPFGPATMSRPIMMDRSPLQEDILGVNFWLHESSGARRISRELRTAAYDVKLKLAKMQATSELNADTFPGSTYPEYEGMLIGLGEEESFFFGAQDYYDTTHLSKNAYLYHGYKTSDNEACTALYYVVAGEKHRCFYALESMYEVDVHKLPEGMLYIKKYRKSGNIAEVAFHNTVTDMVFKDGYHIAYRFSAAKLFTSDTIVEWGGFHSEYFARGGTFRNSHIPEKTADYLGLNDLEWEPWITARDPQNPNVYLTIEKNRTQDDYRITYGGSFLRIPYVGSVVSDHSTSEVSLSLTKEDGTEVIFHIGNFNNVEMSTGGETEVLIRTSPDYMFYEEGVLYVKNP